MSLSDIEAVRLRSSDKSAITREVSQGDNTTRFWKLQHQNISTSPAIEVRVNASVIPDTQYTLNATQGVIEFTTAPTLGQEVEFIYYWSVFSDAEVQYFLDTAGSNITVATANLLMALAADASKIAQRQSMAGGGGLGSVTLDTSVTARELRASAAALLQMEKDAGESIPAEGLTEVAWGEFGYHDIVSQRYIRGNR